MSPRILLVGRSSPLLSELAAAAAEAGFQVLTTTTEEGAVDSGAREGPRSLPWNPRSLVSSRAVVMKAAHGEGGFQAALVLANPERHGQAISETSSGLIEDTIDDAVKGRLFMLKELFSHFEKRGGGSIALVSLSSEATQAPVDAAASGAFESIGDSLFLASEGTGLSLRGYRFESGDAGEFARFVFEQIGSESRRGLGKWFRYTGKSRRLSLGL
mgnify:CR=1 FL=1